MELETKEPKDPERAESEEEPLNLVQQRITNNNSGERIYLKLPNMEIELSSSKFDAAVLCNLALQMKDVCTIINKGASYT